MIPLFYPFIPKEDILKEISDTLDGRWLGQGPKVEQFEKEFGEKFGYKYCLFVNAGTSALELAYHLIGLKEGDEVVTPVMNCTAGMTGLIRRGVKPVFTDVTDELLIDVEDAKKRITEKTKAIVAVNLGGMSVDDGINDLGLPVIMDMAQDHRPTKGKYIMYSFQAIKHMTTADGGMLVLDNKEEYERAKKLRWFGIDRDAKAKADFQAYKDRKMTTDIEEVGYKYQPTDIDACFGLASLPYLPEIIAYRQSLAGIYQTMLPNEKLVWGGSCWLMCIMTEWRDELAEFLKEHDIETNMVQMRNDIFSAWGGEREDLPMMDYVEGQYLYLPMNLEVTTEDVRFICEKINEFRQIKEA